MGDPEVDPGSAAAVGWVKGALFARGAQFSIERMDSAGVLPMTKFHRVSFYLLLLACRRPECVSRALLPTG